MQYFYYAVAFLVATVAVMLVVNRQHDVIVDAPLPAEFSSADFPHTAFEKLLAQYVDIDGRVNYEAWDASSDAVGKLDGYLAGVSQFSPDNAPDRFRNRSNELAYWMYGYNAYVIKSVLDHWPIASVTDIKAPLEVVTGLGFFHRQRFKFGGEYLSLLAVENEKIREQYQDARIHFVLSCASGSCPIVRPELPTGNALEEFLATAATEFASDPGNIAVDHEARRVVLSRIFKWYRKDFENELRKVGLPIDNGLITYAQRIAPEPLAVELAAASNYEVVFHDYDWALNSSK